MILLRRHRFPFICEGTTGTTSLEQVLAPLQERAVFGFGVPNLFVPTHTPPALHKAVLPGDIQNGSSKFAFVRNPWDLFVSNWH